MDLRAADLQSRPARKPPAELTEKQKAVMRRKAQKLEQVRSVLLSAFL